MVARHWEQYQFLQNIFLGDSVRVIARRIGVEVSMRMTQYTYDCLTRKYTAVSLGTVADGRDARKHLGGIPPRRHGPHVFYEWKRRFQTHGLEGLKDMPPIPKSQPNQTTPKTEAAIVKCSLAHPSWGCVKLSDFLKLQDVSVSSPTVQKNPDPK